MEWYFVKDPDAKFLTDKVLLNKFGSASWLDGYTDDNALGEIVGATRTFTKGIPSEYPCSCEPTGDLKGFFSGVDGSATPLVYNDNGIPLECVDLLGAFDTGYDVGYDT